VNRESLAVSLDQLGVNPQVGPGIAYIWVTAHDAFDGQPSTAVVARGKGLVSPVWIAA